jgi:hypothetical protein
MTTRSASILLGIVFIAVGLLGYVDNPIIYDSDEAVFHANSTHNMVHIISGIAFLLIAFAAPRRAGLFMKIFGAVYLLLGILGLATIGDDGMTELLGFLHVNGADNYLHIGLGLLIFLASMLPEGPVVDRDRRTTDHVR